MKNRQREQKEEKEIRSEYGVYWFNYIIQKMSQEVFFNGFTLPKYIRKQQKEAKKNVPQEHHREQQAINLILIWTAFFQRTVDVELNQRISKNKTLYSMLSKMYRMRKTSRCFLNHLMMKTTRNLLL